MIQFSGWINKMHQIIIKPVEIFCATKTNNCSQCFTIFYMLVNLTWGQFVVLNTNIISPSHIVSFGPLMEASQVNMSSSFKGLAWIPCERKRTQLNFQYLPYGWADKYNCTWRYIISSETYNKCLNSFEV